MNTRGVRWHHPNTLQSSIHRPTPSNWSKQHPQNTALNNLKIYREPTNLFTFPSAICVGYRLHRICAITPHMVVYKHRGIQRSEEVLSPKSNAHQSDYYAYIFFGINESMPTNGRMPIRGLNCERNALAQTPNYIQSIIPRSTTLILSNIQSEATLFDDTPLKRSLMELCNLLLYYTTCPRWQVLFQLDVSSFPSLS